MIQAEDVLKLYKLFEENGIEVWIDGGWGVDALLGTQTRPHNDLDIAIAHKDVSKLRNVLIILGYKEKSATSKYNFVLSNDNGHEIDVHSFEFDEKGINVSGIAYPKESLTGTGKINGQPVKCISAEYVIKFHGSYEPSKKHINDIKALCAKFGVELPENYKDT